MKLLKSIKKFYQIKKKWLEILLLIILTLIISGPYFKSGFPYTHDGENHLARFANYKIALKEGQLPPRFAPNLMNHYGYPVFNYNYPLANILSLPFSFLKINYELTFKLIGISFIFCGLLGLKLLLKKNKINFINSLFAILVFATSPYLITLINFRGNIGELMAIMLLPWLFLLIEKKNVNFVFEVLIWTAFLLSHNVAVLFAVPILFLFALVNYKNDISAWINLLIRIIWAGCLGLWFWLPAVFEKRVIILDNVDLSKSFINQFSTFRQLFLNPLEFGFSLSGSVDSLMVGTGLMGLIFLILSVIVILKEKNNFKLFSLVLISFGLLVFQLKFAKEIWTSIPFLNFIQFPWRLQLYLAILIAFISGLVIQKLKFKWQIFLWAILLSQLLIIIKIKPVDYFHKNIIDYDAFSQSTSTNNENLPKTFKYQNIADWQPTAIILKGDGKIITNFWSGSRRNYQLILNSESVVVEPTMNFLGWQTYIYDQQKISGVNSWQLTNNRIKYIDDEEIGGRIAYRLPAGEYEVISKFTQKTMFRTMGNFVSLLSLITLLIFICKDIYVAGKKYL